MTSSLPCGQTSLLLQMTERLALSDAHFRRISQLIYQRAGIVLADHKRDMVLQPTGSSFAFAGTDGFRSLSELAGI
ncbi:chemotaxis protein methyltransferase [Escherichia coli]|uniref:Chemotaxis protein methyltransferase n=1 Tax=Escherichia coli TaxID=562 RepID=A0A2X1ND58_ECOLX|nr:chemotaxis protein methyltransferase [Escherichia coli]